MLKQTNDGISKSWKPFRSHEPFYNGGKTHITLDEKKLICLHSDNVKIVDLTTGDIINELLDEDDDNRELITCFCVHPNGK
jgi:hypothetical protein